MTHHINEKKIVRLSASQLSQIKNIYFMGIGGTGMSAAAGLAKKMGFSVTGSDIPLYPPTSTILENANIHYRSPYDRISLAKQRIDAVVVANALSRGHKELESAIENEIPLTSFPELLEFTALTEKHSVVISGTHGKTTTTTLFSYLMQELRENPSYLIGGQPHDLSSSYEYNSEGKFFIIEGDEYDTIFFDKESKFLHYRPKWLVINNLEFDHADIFADLSAIKKMFAKLCHLVEQKENILANADDPEVYSLIVELGLEKKITWVSPLGKSNLAKFRLLDYSIDPEKKWHGIFQLGGLQKFAIETHLTGKHNLGNILQVLTCLYLMNEKKELFQSLDLKKCQSILKNFRGVKRRMDLLGEKNDIAIYEDFAHHPTAIREVILGIRSSFPNKRILVAFEPKNATARRNVLLSDFAHALSHADLVFIGPSPIDQRIVENKRMDTQQMQNAIGNKATSFTSNENLLEAIKKDLQKNDLVIFMSSGSFSGVQYQLAHWLIS